MLSSCCVLAARLRGGGAEACGAGRVEERAGGAAISQRMICTHDRISIMTCQSACRKFEFITPLKHQKEKKTKRSEDGRGQKKRSNSGGKEKNKRQERAGGRQKP